MADYYNALNHEWTLQEGKLTYRISIGLNKNLPDGLDAKFPKMLVSIKESSPQKPKIEEPTPKKPEPIEVKSYKSNIKITHPTIKNPKITLITPTGDRPFAFDLCQNWMSRQTVKYFQWIVIDDGKVPMTPKVEMQYIRREPKPNDPKCTLALNISLALNYVKGDYVFIIEDDEYYAPNYLETMMNNFGLYFIIGLKDSRYYHLQSGGYIKLKNPVHASLAETAFIASIVPEVKKIVDSKIHKLPPYFDIDIWKQFYKQSFLFDDETNPIYLGIKGLPGRGGAGAGHTPDLYKLRDDENRSVLKRLVSKDYQTYLNFIKDSEKKEITIKQQTKRFEKVLCDIVVLSYNQENYTIDCFESLKRSTNPNDYRVIWVDNGSESTSKGEEILKGTNHVVVKMCKNIGFVGATNKGIALSNSEYICLLNNDTILSKNWLVKMIDALKKNPDIGILGTLTSPPQSPKAFDSHHSIEWIEEKAKKTIFPKYTNLEDFNRKIEKQFSGVVADCIFVAFLCSIIRRSVFDKVGYLDENFGMGMYDDNDYNLRVRKLGIKTKLLYDTCITHYGNRTFAKMRDNENFDLKGLLDTSRSYFENKWKMKA